MVRQRPERHGQVTDRRSALTHPPGDEKRRLARTGLRRVIAVDESAAPLALMVNKQNRRGDTTAVQGRQCRFSLGIASPDMDWTNRVEE